MAVKVFGRWVHRLTAADDIIDADVRKDLVEPFAALTAIRHIP